MNAGSNRVLQISESLHVEYGGLAVACAQLAGHLAGAGAAVTVATVDGHRQGRRVPLDARVGVIECAPTGPAFFGFSSALAASIDRVSPSVVHVHGLWRLYLRQAAQFTERHGVPLIISTHGMLHEPARRQRGALKAIVRWLGQDDILKNAVCLHATANEEAAEIRKLGIRTPVAVIPWGVDPPAGAPAQPSSDQRVVLFLGRFHPTKGLDALLRAWVRTVRDFPSTLLVLAGYDDDGFRAQFQKLADSLGLARSVAFRGPVEGAEREHLFSASHLLILPSPSENFGLVVPEALVRGIPVIATQGTPWSAVVDQGCGWWVRATEEGLAGALHEALGASPAALAEMGVRGRRFALATFAWDRVAASMQELYAWTLGQAPVPSFVQP